MVQWWNDYLEKAEGIQAKPCTSATSPTTNLTQIHPELNITLHGEKPMSKCMSYGTAYLVFIPALKFMVLHNKQAEFATCRFLNVT
jgi:hypothetical protein